MHAMLAANSDPGSLTEQTVDIPEPAKDDLLVQVRATALTAGELGWPEIWPAVPCHDLSGVVAAAGTGGDRLAAGRRGVRAGRLRPARSRRRVRHRGRGRRGGQARRGQPQRGGRGAARRAHRLAGPAHPRQRAARPARPGPRRGRGRRLCGAARRPERGGGDRHRLGPRPRVRGRPGRQPGHRLRRWFHRSGPRRRHRRRPGRRRGDGRVLQSVLRPGGRRWRSPRSPARTPAAGPT